MISLRGVYENGAVKFKEKVQITGETHVTPKFLKDCKGFLGGTVSEERRSKA